MDILLISLRIVHIVLGVIWVGSVVFTTFYLAPAVQDTGPDGGKVMAALQRRGLMTVLPVIAAATLLSGLWLYWRASLGFEPAYMGSRPGIAFGFGGAAAIAGYVIGLAFMRPAMMRAAAIAQQLGTIADDQERQARMGDLHRLRARGTTMGRVVAVLLLLAVTAMAVARYL